MQERVYKQDTRPRPLQRLEAAPHWHTGKRITKHHRRSCWSMEKRYTQKKRKDISLNIC